MAMLQTISTQVAPDIFARLQKIAQTRQCSSSDIIKELVENYISLDDYIEKKVSQGLEDVRMGRVVSHEDVKEEFRRLGVDVD